MATSAPERTTNHTRQNRSRRFRAILAGGLVLGVGAAVTLAAWNDSEFAQGTFTAGSFNMVGSTDGTTFTDHATAAVGTVATLPFTVPAVNLTPGDTTYAGFAVRLTAATTTDAVVTVSNSATTGVVTNLSYTVIDTGATFGCTADSTGTALIPAATAIGTVPASTTFTLPKGVSTGVDGVAHNLCFKVTAGPGLTQGQSGTATWQFLAASATQ
jgi:predicted ribosomally synthesized peptide with SipW-like signal peptide